MISLSSHVLDTTLGKPAARMALTLTTPDGQKFEQTTNDDGRCSDFDGAEFSPGGYCLRFHCKDYLLEQHGKSFYPFVDIHFDITESSGHYHIPLLISPFGYSSYRGS
ncbi:MAG: hydroxyisourate hydrolase [Pseudomonadota bacterium]